MTAQSTRACWTATNARLGVMLSNNTTAGRISVPYNFFIIAFITLISSSDFIETTLLLCSILKAFSCWPGFPCFLYEQ